MPAALTLCLAACNTATDEPAGPAANRIAIAPTISNTRATEMNFEKGDMIGLSIIRANGELHTENALLTHDGNLFSGNIDWYTETNEASHLVAYHPYDTAGAPSSFTVALDQSGEGYGKSDLLGASKPGVAPGASPVGVTFKHLLSKINVNVTNESSADVTSVILRGSVPRAGVDLQALAAAVDRTLPAADITAQPVTAGALYRAIVVPQQVALTVIVATSNGKSLAQTLAMATLRQGAQYKVDVTVSAEQKLNVTLSGEIFGWTDEGSIDPAEELYTITFEGEYWEAFVAANYNGKTYTNSVHGNYTYPLWIDATTQLTTDYPTWFNDDRGNSIGYDYPWILSSYNSGDIKAFGDYMHDLYVYNPDNANATSGGGRNGSNNFLVAFGYMENGPYSLGDYRPVFKFADGKARTIKSLWLNSTNYFLSVAASGNGLSPALAPGEDVTYYATGYDADGNETGTVTMVYASYERLVKEWTQWDISELGPIVALKLNQLGGTDNGYGYSLPAYYAIDDITVVMK